MESTELKALRAEMEEVRTRNIALAYRLSKAQKAAKELWDSLKGE